MPTKSLWLLSSGKDKLRVIKIINNSTNHGLAESERLVENTPSLILTDESWKMKSVEKQLVSAGCSVEYRNSNSMSQNAGNANSYEKMVDGTLIELAERDDPEACIELSARYRLGTPTLKKDERLANYWQERGRELVSGIGSSACVPKKDGKNMPDVKKMFLSRTSNWFGERNTSDCLYNQIPEIKKKYVRTEFGLSFDEEIIFIRDTSWINIGDQGLVITDNAIYCIPDNDNPEDKTIIPWTSMQRAEYKDLVINIYASFKDGSGECPIPISFFTKSSDEAKQASVGRQLAPLLTKVCQSFPSTKDPVDLAWEKYRELIEAGKDEEAFHLALETYNQGVTTFSILISECYCKKGDWKQALSYCDKYLSEAEVGSQAYVYGMYQKESIFCDLKDYAQLRKYAFLTAKYATDERNDDDDVLIKEDAQKDFNDAEAIYVQGFLKQPYNQRKLLMPVREYVDLSQNHISVIDINNLPSAIEFPIGHPTANQLYVGHPYLNNKYILFENYQLVLVEDKVREFCHIAQCLGATDISIDAENSTQNSSTRNYNKNVDGGVSYGGVDVKGAWSRGKNKSLIDEISQAISLHQTFKPTKEPFIPENTVWLKNEPSWIRLCEQRMTGGLIQHEERIETRKSQVVDNHELQEIKAEMQSLFAEVNIAWNSSMDEKFSQQENAVLSIKVTFTPIGSISNVSSTNTDHVLNSYSKNELEYLENIKEFYEDDAEITARERRMLDRIRQRLGISEERASELEASLKPQLTEDEQEYLDMFNDYVENGGIFEKERRRLDKYAAALGITPDRVNEIEKMAK